MNKKNLLLLIAALCIGFNTFASEVNLEKARVIAKNFYFEKANLLSRRNCF